MWNLRIIWKAFGTRARLRSDEILRPKEGRQKTKVDGLVV